MVLLQPVGDTVSAASRSGPRSLPARAHASEPGDPDGADVARVRSYVAVTFFGIWDYGRPAVSATRDDHASHGRFLDLEGLSQQALPEERGPDGKSPTFPFVLVTTYAGDEAPPPSRLRFYATSEAERATWMAAIDAALALWAAHATPARADEGRLLLRSSVFDQFGLLRKASAYSSDSTEWRAFVLEFNSLRYSRALSLLDFDRYARRCASDRHGLRVCVHADRPACNAPGRGSPGREPRSILLDGCYAHPQHLDRPDGTCDYYLNLLERGRNGDTTHAFILQMRDRDELSTWLQAITIASKLTQDVPFAAVYRLARTRRRELP